jgi:GNAT superfamily N-acetyltransferase
MIEIREYVAARDREGVRACTIELQDYERALDPRMPAGAAIADAYPEEMAEECAKQRGAVFVAADADRIVGYVCVLARVIEKYASEPLREYALVTDLVVLASHRGRGIARRLIDRAQSFARESGAHWLRISVLAQNTAARTIYADLGFHEYEIVLERKLIDADSPDAL